MGCRLSWREHNRLVGRVGFCPDPGHLDDGSTRCAPVPSPWAARLSVSPACWTLLAMICCLQENAWAMVVTEWRLPITDGACWEEEAGSTIPQVLGFGSSDAAVAWAKWNADRQPDWRPWAMPSPTTSLDDYRLDWPVADGKGGWM